MTDYLGPLTFGANSASDTYCLTKWDSDGGAASLEVIVKGTSSDTLATYMEALIAQLRIGNTYAHFQPGNTYPTVYTVVGVSAFKLDALESWHAFWQRVSFALTLAGQPAGALTTLYAATSTLTPASQPLSALLGTNPTMLDVTIDDSSGNDMHSVWCALAPTALSDAKWRVYADALTWTTMSNDSTACGALTYFWNAHNRYTVSSSYQTAPLDTAQYPGGKYRLLARVCQEAGMGYVKDSQNDTAVAITRTTPHLLVIGDLDLPTADTAPGTAANLTVSVKSDGTNDCIINAFLLIPLDYGFFSWHHATATTEIDQLDVGPTGVFMDGTCDATYLAGGPLVPRILAAHVGTLVATASPTGANWPADWGRTDGTDVTAASSKFHVVLVTESKFAWYAATNLATPLVIPGAWYELTLTRQVTARSAGAATVDIVWQDLDGNTVLTQNLSSVTATDASPVNLELYAKAPAHAARAQVKVGGGAGATITADFSAVVLRRCPLRLIVVAEDATGALSSNTHAVALTLKYRPYYEVSR